MELATFCWQLNTMLSGGLSITVAIQTIADEISNPYFEYILKDEEYENKWIKVIS